LLLNCTLKYTTGNIQEKPGRTGIEWKLVNADDDSLLGKNMNTIKKHTESLLNARKEDGLLV
jgi:hypothetical protein